ncbi:4-methylaminobutanoate oxidase (formaldehyde-forming) [Aquicella siphonis]|uniref:4-methylaminobutanoate oxidase (Formaldehyde-forming) n=1 Tax=Aquicella siphonis TaxID=254247 RepID=A0A5E4PLG0_9COXI|nr:FAD-dependent oxidoreductase [Aquicella siphonis]VVC77217.1 4-methylaminobutanoate oxidase (formaldehyde-forming) [Aquicella siphonis]
MAREQADIVIVGAGITGCAIFHELSKRKMGKIVLLEACRIAGKTTGQSGGLIRQFALEPALRACQIEGFQYYHRFHREVGSSCSFHQTGLISRISRASVKSLRVCKNELNPEHYPVIWHDDGDTIRIHEPLAGSVNPVQTSQAWVSAGKAHHGVCYENRPVSRILGDTTGVQGVETSCGEIRSEKVILAAGPMTPALMRTVNLECKIRIKSFQYHLYQRASTLFETAHLDFINDFYVLPLRDGNVLAGCLHQDEPVIHGSDPLPVNNHTAFELHVLIAQQFPALEKAEYSVHTSVDTFTCDGRTEVNAIMPVKGLIVVPPANGGGIKTAPAIAKRITAMLIPHGTA